MNDIKREMLRHALATIAYRGGKVLRGTSEEFARFDACEGVRTPAAILAHLGDLLEWALSMVKGSETWKSSEPQGWNEEVSRFYAEMRKLDDYLASGEPLHVPAENLFQGPIADALTHVGQIGMLRRMAGIPVKGENYFAAGVTIGRVGQEQEPPAYEFG